LLYIFMCHFSLSFVGVCSFPGYDDLMKQFPVTCYALAKSAIYILSR